MSWIATGSTSLVRTPNTSLKFPEEPGHRGFRLEDALGLSFDIPTRVVFAPGETNRVFILEQGGSVVVVTNLAAPTKTTFLNVRDSTFMGPEEGLVSLVFHPRYAENGRFFVHRVVRDGIGDAALIFNQVSEFQVSASDPSRAEATSEKILIRQQYKGRNHYGGDLHFGRDGYLYGSCGDGYFPDENSQRIDGDFFSAIWRIDVDQRPESLAPNPHKSSVGGYRIPPDNPFVGATSFLGKPVDPTKVRTELWSVGLRNPFRFSFDPQSGDLWVGDVGFETYESVFVTSKGANHGWPALEGTAAGFLPGTVPSDFPKNPAYRYSPPVFSYSHDQGHCVLGGEVYRGTRFSSIHGFYLFADHSWGWFTALRRNPNQTTDLVSLGYLPGITSIEINKVSDEVWISELSKNRIWKLAYSGVFTGDPLPATLAETGAFSNLKNVETQPGIVEYAVNQPFWSDGAQKRRWFSVPNVADQVEFRAEGAWEAPPGTVWIKHFDFELTNGVPTSSRRLETRFLVRNKSGVYGVTYRWSSSDTAELVPEEGLNETLATVDNGSSVSRQWRFPSRGECLTCHTRAGGLSLSFNSAQLHRAGPYSTKDGNQIQDLSDAGYFKTPAAPLRRLPTLTAASSTDASLESRARSYLASNCGGCHRPGGSGLGLFDARLETPTASSGLINGPLLGSRTDPLDRVITPGDPNHSVLFLRLSTRGPGQMPPLASFIMDPQGVQLIREWILSLANSDPETAPSVQPLALTEGRLLKVNQPANRRLLVEHASTLDSGDWEILDLPGTEWVFPTSARDVEIPLPSGDDSQFFRVLSVAP